MFLVHIFPGTGSCNELFFLWAIYFMGSFQGILCGGQDFVDPLIVHSAARDNLGIKKSSLKILTRISWENWWWLGGFVPPPPSFYSKWAVFKY
jgi:hypothetical protein